MAMTKNVTEAKASGSNQHREVDRSCDSTYPKTLSEMGITKDQSSNWQKLANVPEEDFERAVFMPGTKPSASHIIRPKKPKPAQMDEDVDLHPRLTQFCAEN